jgi:hypothetical protein
VLKLRLATERITNGAYRFDVVGLRDGQEEQVASYAFDVNHAQR